MFNKNHRVMTPKGPGTVLYRRMQGPDYVEAAGYSILLDSSKEAASKPPFPKAAGTIFPAEEVTQLYTSPGRLGEVPAIDLELLNAFENLLQSFEELK